MLKDSVGVNYEKMEKQTNTDQYNLVNLPINLPVNRRVNWCGILFTLSVILGGLAGIIAVGPGAFFFGRILLGWNFTSSMNWFQCLLTWFFGFIAGLIVVACIGGIIVRLAQIPTKENVTAYFNYLFPLVEIEDKESV